MDVHEPKVFYNFRNGGPLNATNLHQHKRLLKRNNNIQMWLFESTSVDPPPARLQSQREKNNRYIIESKLASLVAPHLPDRPSFSLSHNPSSIGFSVPVVYIVIILCQLSAELHN